MGKLKIGDHWNAITIIALSQTNPLKAIAEFVENSIDAKAKNITILRGKQHNEYYLKVMDDGEGITDFNYVATHIGDSIKRKLKSQGIEGIQGEFGIGLLSFWTVGEELTITSHSSDGKIRRMKLVKGNPAYFIEEISSLFDRRGTELHIQPILPGIRQLTGEKIQNYLASELRDRISKSGVHIRISDKTMRKELVVEPRKFHGRLLHNLPEPKSPLGDIYLELYLAQPSSDNVIGLYRRGTRIIPSITQIDRFNRQPWSSKYLEGIIDVSFLQLTPGTRDGFIYDDSFDSFSIALEGVENALMETIKAQEKAEEEEASKTILNKVTRALREAFLYLPQEEYGWLSVNARKSVKGLDDSPETASPEEGSDPNAEETMGDADKKPGNGLALSTDASKDSLQPENYKGEPPIPIYDFRFRDGGRTFQNELLNLPGPIYSLSITPGKCILPVGGTKKLKAVVRDRQKRPIETDLLFEWSILEGAGKIEPTDGSFVTYTASDEPGLTMIELKALQGNIGKTATTTITVTAELIPQKESSASGLRKGLPGYTYQKAPGELWRSKFDEENSLVVINNAHADFVYASKTIISRLRYIARLFAKELVMINFPEASKEEILERLVELTLYTEEHLR